ncbi:DUF1592 domain-containing protein [Fuerstiella marisgermanici]|uniref:Planctomycete cytochrome C n=1 Tax=Fuerstiella marisgermanici TaxID=1891926 RepID=A0A1P8WSJ6_9PLAN|nr:DUF1592 domain-containing protein [Fuerstiella marisgermanici]APZ97028.1 Planctomycete cytochrome C [Fuerstiella marisgermanici]
MKTALLLAIAVTSVPSTACADPWHQQLQPFFTAHCLDCHGDSDGDGELDLSALKTELSDAEATRRWTLIHDRIANGEMPPKGQLRPKPAEVKNTLNILSDALTMAHRRQNDVVFRRLNRIEYENTVRDLFGIFVVVNQTLPQDTSTSGFDNVGEGLAVSAEAAQAYLEAADIVLDAVFGPSKKPKYIQHKTNLATQSTHDGKLFNAKQIGKMFRRTDKGLVIFQSNYCPTNLVNFARERPPAGTYRGTLQVRAIQSDKPVTLRIYGGDTIVGRREKHVVGYYDVPPEWTTIQFTDRLVEDNGTFQPKCYGTRDTRKDADTYPEPGLEIGDITIEGPLEEWPPPSRAALFGDVDPEIATLDDAKQILNRITPKAFRRPVSAEEMTPYFDLVESALAADRSFEGALRLALKAILCSPEFLFLDEPATEQISQHAIASRLSYFLWSSLPDDELLALADAGSLNDAEVLQQQVERLLKDDRSKAFTENFVGQWLDLRDINFTSPDANLYPEFDELLQISMIEETRLFFNEVLHQNLSLMNFVDSDFTFLNERLAKHYNIPGIHGHTIYRKVDLPEDSVRGGVLTQASVLKVTANGTNTSPVTRGMWVLENIMGQHVSPPPSNVGSVEPDIRGATTLREQLAKHRNVESCAACHNKIDPAGFALENFDVIGGYRDRYRTLGEGERPSFGQDPNTFAWVRYRIGRPVDATGQTPDGTAFRNIRELKQILLQDQESIARGLTEKLITYALGRRVGFSDRLVIEQIVKNIAAQNYGFRTLVHEVVQSDLLQRP